MFHVGPDQLVTPKERYYLAIVFFLKVDVAFHFRDLCF